MKHIAVISFFLCLTPSAFALQSSYQCGDHSRLVKIGRSGNMTVFQYRPSSSRYLQSTRRMNFDFNVLLDRSGQGSVVDQNGSQIGTAATPTPGYLFLQAAGIELRCYNVPVDTSGGNIEYTPARAGSGHRMGMCTPAEIRRGCYTLPRGSRSLCICR